MPIYEYQCTSCGNKTEVIQKISDAPLSHCEACGKDDLKKLVSAAAFRLSGSGWYETDFKSGNKKNLSSKEKTESKPKPEKSTGKAAASCCSGGACAGK
jgi:putative FmdB family regulatory protein